MPVDEGLVGREGVADEAKDGGETIAAACHPCVLTDRARFERLPDRKRT